ncbi:endonuclease I [Haloferax sp. Atlit-12N]|uniref:helix-turn-helix domain-containing protein n=1 Tax=Haloferax sp. Atlit-12N TaxID=2077203 RepID=UPI000E27CFE9|nr:endonuclease I [Haloferax sp. Atlit-12N]
MRYEWLDERVDELIERYEAGQSLREIADVFDVSAPTIHRRLQDHDVAMRNGGPAYTQLANRREELVEAYERRSSLQSLADQYDTSPVAIRFHLEKAGADPISLPKTTDHGLSPSQVSVIQGELLGDGCLHSRYDGSCFFQLSTTTEEHARRLITKLPDGFFPKSQPNSITRLNQFTDEDYTSWVVSSRPQPLLQRMYEEWYEVRDEKNNRKIVPKDYHLDKTALLHWYWGDGNCSIRDSGAPRVSFATHGFPESCVEHLQSEVDRLGYDNYAVRQKGIEDGSGLYIRLRDYDARTFLDDLRRSNTLMAYDYKFPVPVKGDE